MKSERRSARKEVRRVSWSWALMVLLAMLGIGSRTDWAGTNLWTNIGPEGGGISLFVIDPQNPDTIYAQTGNGMFKTTNGGTSWSAAASSGLPSRNVQDLTMDPKTSGTLYALVSYETGDGSSVFKSTDGGDSWNFAGAGLPRKWLGTLTIDPQNPGTLYAAASDGLFKTVDGGESWNPANSGLPSGSYPINLTIDPLQPDTVYAWSGIQFGLPLSPIGVYKSTDWGTSWNAANSGLTAVSVFSLVMPPQNSRTIYAVSDGLPFKSTDGGESWNAINMGLPYWDLVNALVVDPATPSTIYVFYNFDTDYSDYLWIPNTGGGILKSTDGGASWSEADSGLPADDYGHIYIGALAIDPQKPGTLYALSSGGVFKTTDGGASWMKSSAPGIPVFDPENHSTLYATTDGGVFKSTDGGASWIEVHSGLPTYTCSIGSCIRVNALAIDPQKPGTVYAATYRGVFKSTDGGASWSAANPGLPADNYGHFYIRALAIAPKNPSALYAVLDDPQGRMSVIGIFMSTDGGENWTAVNPGITASYVYALALDPQTPNTLYAGTPDGVFGLPLFRKLSGSIPTR